MMIDDATVYRNSIFAKDCWYQETCKYYGGEHCTEKCHRFQQTDYLFQTSNLPKKKWCAQRLTTDFLDDYSEGVLEMINGDIRYFVHNGHNLYLYGGTGSGKTSWAVKLLNNYFASIAEDNDFETRGVFVNTSTLFVQSRLHMTYKSQRYIQLIEQIRECKLVVWDDIFQTNPSEYESQLIYSLINDRIFAERANIFTSNLTPDELSMKDARLYSRCCENSDCIKVDGYDMRKLKTYTSQMNNMGDAYNGTTSNPK